MDFSSLPKPLPQHPFPPPPLDSKKTVTLTLWGPTAEGLGAELESRAAQHPVLSVSACRVSAFNGVSVSTLHRSVPERGPRWA